MEDDPQTCEIVVTVPLSLFLSFLFTQNGFAFSGSRTRSYKQTIGIIIPSDSPWTLLNNHTVTLSQDLQGRLALRKWAPVPGYVQGESLKARPHRGRLRAPSAWQGKWAGRLALRLPLPPAPNSLPPGTSAYQSIAASMPWFPVRARAFSLGAETP